MMEKRWLVVLGCLGMLAGCGPSVKTLMEYDSEGKAQRTYVNAADEKFALLLSDIEQKRLQPGGTKRRVIAHYGEPVLDKDNILLYRPATKFFGTKKVYLTFDADDILKKVEVVKE